jgi:hypothetical protein
MPPRVLRKGEGIEARKGPFPWRTANLASSSGIYPYAQAKNRLEEELSHSQELTMKLFPATFLAAALIVGCAAPALAIPQYSDQPSARQQNTQAYSKGYAQGQADARNHVARNDQGNPQWTTADDQQAYRHGYDAGYSQTTNGTAASPESNMGTGDRQAQQFGYQDGLAAGRDDATKGNGFKPASHDFYKKAMHGWTSGLGTKTQFQQAYREAFMKGYGLGYRGTDPR